MAYSFMFPIILIYLIWRGWAVLSLMNCIRWGGGGYSNGLQIDTVKKKKTDGECTSLVVGGLEILRRSHNVELLRAREFNLPENHPLICRTCDVYLLCFAADNVYAWLAIVQSSKASGNTRALSCLQFPSMTNQSRWRSGQRLHHCNWKPSE